MHRCALRLTGLALMTTLIASCGAAPSSRVDISHTCPPVVEYTAEFQAQAADELALLPAESAIAEMMKDYKVMRDQSRAC